MQDPVHKKRRVVDLGIGGATIAENSALIASALMGDPGVKKPTSGEIDGIRSFDQVVANLYGYIKPGMLRAFAFHKYLLELVLGTKLRDPLGSDGKTKNCFSRSLHPQKILEEMELTQYLNLVGVGAKCNFIEEYLRSASGPVYLKNIDVRKSNGLAQRSGKRDLHHIRKMLQQLQQIGLVEIDTSAGRADGSNVLYANAVRYKVKHSTLLENKFKNLGESTDASNDLDLEDLTPERTGSATKFFFHTVHDAKPFWEALKRNCMRWLDENAKKLQEDAKSAATPSSQGSSGQFHRRSHSQEIYPLRNLVIAFRKGSWAGHLTLTMRQRRQLEGFWDAQQKVHIILGLIVSVRNATNDGTVTFLSIRDGLQCCSTPCAIRPVLTEIIGQPGRQTPLAGSPCGGVVTPSDVGKTSVAESYEPLCQKQPSCRNSTSSSSCRAYPRCSRKPTTGAS